MRSPNHSPSQKNRDHKEHEGSNLFSRLRHCDYFLQTREDEDYESVLELMLFQSMPHSLKAKVNRKQGPREGE